MKTLKITCLFAGLAMAGLCYSEVKITFPADYNQSTLEYNYAPINQYANAKSRAERGVIKSSVPVTNNSTVIPSPENSDNYFYWITVGDDDLLFYTSPGDALSIDINAINPLDYNISGSLLADGMNQLLQENKPVFQKFASISAQREPTEAEIAEFNDLQKNFISSNPDSPAAAIALMNLDGQDFLDVYESMPNGIKNSILLPLIDKQYTTVKKNIEREQRQKALESGDKEAPAFTLKDLQGKEVSLSDFRGKWVILDFWGSWCPWCIKGFPELKEAYKNYAGSLEIIGIDCNESEADWRAGVEKYQLPWVNVYNPAGSTLTEEYGVQGFPTKAIIDPEGKVRNITVGHVPTFFDTLTELMKQ